jgi:hypothetical protein
VEDVKVTLPILYVRWDLKSFVNLSKVFQYQGITKNNLEVPPLVRPPKTDIKASPSLRSSANYPMPALFNLKLPRVQLYIDFASMQRYFLLFSLFSHLTSPDHTISAIDFEISEVRVRKIPIPENSTRKWFIEFDGANSWIIDKDLGNTQNVTYNTNIFQ